ncbi:MAG: hypothetical protein JKY90_01155 [Gammaproteobacteria bacterium]|nr:hypothetical protein [Gammaproteobacteria bacterium]
MKTIIIFLLLVVFCSVTSISVASPADKQVESALADISKYEDQFAGKATVQSNTIKRTLKLLGLTRQRLDSSTNQASPSWQEADVRYNNLVEKLNGFLVPQKSTASKSAAAAPVTTQQNTAPKTSNSTTQMISQQRVRIKKINRDIISSTDTIDKNGPKPFQDVEYVSKWQKKVDQFKQSLSKYKDFSTDSKVIAANQSLQEMENMMVFGRSHAAKEIEALGNVQQRLHAIDTAMHSMGITDEPQQPFKQGDLSQWLTNLSKLRQYALTTHTPLPEIKNRAYLPNTRFTVEQDGVYDMQDVDRLERGLISTVTKIDSNLATFSVNLAEGLKHVSMTIDRYSTYDPANVDDQSQHFLFKGRADEARAEFARDRNYVSAAAEFDKFLKRETHKGKIKLLQQLDAAAKQYEANYRTALKLVRMPKSVTSDAELVKIAKQTLTNPKYEYVGGIKRLVVSAEKVHREKQTSNVEYDKVDISLSGNIKLSGTETTYSYAWDEFQVATAESEADKYYIFYTTFKYFTKGGSTTPLNKWIISDRIHVGEIPAENISLD